MKPIFIILLTWTLVAGESPPQGNYYSSAYDDLPYQGHSHSHSPHHHHHHQQPHHESPSRHHEHSHAHAPHGNVEHEVIVQHHHYSPSAHTGRVVSHGAPESEYTPTHSHSKPHRGHHHSHHHHGTRAHAIKTYSIPAKTEEAPALYSGYSSYKGNDYKAYLTPSTHSDDYGIEAYSPTHSGDYGASSSYQNYPTAYKGVALSYAPPGTGYSPQTLGLSSYTGADHLDDHAVSYRPVVKSVPSHKHRSPIATYISQVAAPIVKTTSAYTKAYSVPKISSYSASPKYVTYNVPSSSKLTYSPPKSYGVPVKQYSKTAYRTTPTKLYSSSSYASHAPSYSYGSPASKGFGYISSYSKPVEKGYVRFAGDEGAYGASPYEEETAQGADEAENYGGSYADGSPSHY